MRRISSAALLIVSLTIAAISAAACGGGDGGLGPKPPPIDSTPAPLPPITRLVLTTDSALVFTGRAVDGRRFLATAYDSSGAVVANPVLTLTASAGWAVRGDTVIAPATESRGTVRITATRAPDSSGASASARRAALRATLDATGGVTDSIAVTSGLDLRAFTWRLTWGCGTTGTSILGDRGNTPLDSATWNAVAVDSVIYPSDSGWVVNYGGVAQMWWTGPVIRYYRDGVADTIIARGKAIVARQAPDTMSFMNGMQNPDGHDDWPAALTDTLPRTYVGGTLCTREWVARKGPVTLRATP